MPRSNTVTLRAREEAVERLTEVVARHKAKGDYKTAAVFAELLVEAQDRLAATETHVMVGDHSPEPRVTHDWHDNTPIGEPDDGTGRWRDI